jgi:hypothetical protein
VEDLLSEAGARQLRQEPNRPLPPRAKRLVSGMRTTPYFSMYKISIKRSLKYKAGLWIRLQRPNNEGKKYTFLVIFYLYSIGTER